MTTDVEVFGIQIYNFKLVLDTHHVIYFIFTVKFIDKKNDVLCACYLRKVSDKTQIVKHF